MVTVVTVVTDPRLRSAPELRQHKPLPTTLGQARKASGQLLRVADMALLGRTGKEKGDPLKGEWVLSERRGLASSGPPVALGSQGSVGLLQERGCGAPRIRALRRSGLSFWPQFPAPLTSPGKLSLRGS